MVTRKMLSGLVFILVNIGSIAVIAGPKDKDHDGMPNNWEQQYGLNISDPADALSDPDHDGFPNLTEYLLGTNPLDEESHPTLSDNREVFIAYWPLATNAVEVFSTNLVGQLKNGASFNNSAVKLDGRDDYVNFGNASALSVTGSISFCLWLKPEQSYGRAIGVSP
ncbi:MAG: hypothetical protein A2283_14710 [Lentisphaerae bacterium RIFOXYA12_FULL_48_11]|nr:MAG: hypothetical protein A2283_14710 [Lentisphaerae bacterium RIFOXYA12_FULL_48_11]